MGLYEDQLAKAARTQEFLQRQIDLSDENKSDVLDALINNTWGTQNQFYIGGNPVDRSDTSINLEAFLLERGIDPQNLPEFVGADIFRPEKLTATRELSQLVTRLGGGIDLREVAEVERSTLYGLSTPDKDKAIASLRSWINTENRKSEDNTDQLSRTQPINPVFNYAAQQNGGSIPFFESNDNQQTERDPQPQTSVVGGSAGILIALAIATVGF